MKTSIAVLILALLLPFIANCAEPAPCIAVYIESHGRGVSGKNSGSRFLTAVWPDGRIVWSRNQEAGGPPFFTARIEPSRSVTVLKQFEERGVFSKDNLRRSWFGPDSSHHGVWLQSGNRRTCIETWHELFETNPNLVVINGGVTSLNGRNRDEVIRNDTKAFREFRQVWSDLRAAITALIPADGVLHQGALELTIPR